MASIAAGEEKTVVLTAPPPAAPAARRIEALDFVRGVALCGILLMNIVDFGLPDAYTNPQNSGGATGINLVTWAITEIGFEGTQRALFSMLFGASVILFTSRLEAQGRPDAADIYMRRNLWLVGFGMAFARAIGEYGSVVFIAGNMPLKTEIASLLIITKLTQYDYVGAAAIAFVLLLLSFVLLLTINAMQGWSARRLGY